MPFPASSGSSVRTLNRLFSEIFLVLNSSSTRTRNLVPGATAYCVSGGPAERTLTDCCAEHPGREAMQTKAVTIAATERCVITEVMVIPQLGQAMSELHVLGQCRGMLHAEAMER